MLSGKLLFTQINCIIISSRYNKPIVLPLTYSNIILIKASIKIQTIVALSVMWAGGITICGYLFFYSDNSAQASYAPVIPINQLVTNNNSILQDNDAYVFVNVDKKHFLTRFVASVPAEDVIPTNKKINTPVVTTVNNTAVEKVYKKPQPAPSNNITQFSIRPVPGT